MGRAALAAPPSPLRQVINDCDAKTRLSLLSTNGCKRIRMMMLLLLMMLMLMLNKPLSYSCNYTCNTMQQLGNYTCMSCATCSAPLQHASSNGVHVFFSRRFIMRHPSFCAQGCLPRFNTSWSTAFAECNIGPTATILRAHPKRRYACATCNVKCRIGSSQPECSRILVRSGPLNR